MKSTKLIPVIAIVTGVLITACGSLGLSLANPQPASNNPGQVPTLAGALPANTPNAQTLGDAQALQSAYETIYQSVSPSVVTIEIGSRSAAPNGSGGTRGDR